MSKLKVETSEESRLVRFDALKIGEVFVSGGGRVCIKTNNKEAIDLEYGVYVILDEKTLVTYVEKAELKLTI